MRLSEAFDAWKEAEARYTAWPGWQTAAMADHALEELSAIAHQNGYEPNGSLGLTEWVVREIAG